MRVPHGKFHLDTIAGWCLRYGAAYPSISGFRPNAEGDPEREAHRGLRSGRKVRTTEAGRRKCASSGVSKNGIGTLAMQSFRCGVRTIPAAMLSLVTLASMLAACASPGQNVVRSDASRRFSCPESRIDVEDLGPRTARASGCGQSAMYSCQQSRASASGFPQQSPLTQGEAANPTQAAGPCTWVIQD